jgi:uncharacterized membrane protein YbhN (UPF0104 family)
MSDRRRNWLRIAGTAISLVLLIWLLARQDWRELLQLSRSIPVLSLIASLALLYVRMFFHTLRWRSLLSAQDIRLGLAKALRLQLSSLFASNFLPTTVGGDVVRLAGVLPISPNRVAATASILVDRAMGVIGMLFVLPLSWPLVSSMLSGALAAVAVDLSAVSDWLRMALNRLGEAMRLWLRTPTSLGLALLAAWTGILCYIISVWLIVDGLAIQLSFLEVSGAIALTYFVALIPISINAYGLRELGVLVFYTQLGATSEQALALGLVTRVLQLIASLPGAVTLGAVILDRGEKQVPDA